MILMVFHRLWRLSSLFHYFFFVFFWAGNLKFLSSNSLILLATYFNVDDVYCILHFIHWINYIWHYSFPECQNRFEVISKLQNFHLVLLHYLYPFANFFHVFHVFFSWLHWNVLLYFLVAYWVSSKYFKDAILFWILYYLNHQSPSCWVWLLKDYWDLWWCYVSLILHVPWRFSLLLLHLEEHQLLQSLLTDFRWEIFSLVLLYILTLSPTLYGCTCSTILAPLCRWILMLVYLFYLITRQAIHWKSLFCFLKDGTTIKDCDFSLAHRPWTVFCAYALSAWAHSYCHTQKYTEGAGHRVERRCGLGTQGVGGACGPSEGILRWSSPSTSWAVFLLEPRQEWAGTTSL